MKKLLNRNRIVQVFGLKWKGPHQITIKCVLIRTINLVMKSGDPTSSWSWEQWSNLEIWIYLLMNARTKMIMRGGNRESTIRDYGKAGPSLNYQGLNPIISSLIGFLIVHFSHSSFILSHRCTANDWGNSLNSRKIFLRFICEIQNE